MRRRQLLASGTALLSVAVAGCGHPNVVLDMDAATVDDIADEASMTVEPGSDEYRLLTSARENETVERSGRHERFDHSSIVRVDGVLYEVTETRLENSEVAVYEVLIEFDPADTTPDIGEIEFDDLPAVDRRHLDPVVSEDDPPDRDGYDIDVKYGTAEEVGNGSVFVPERQYDIIIHDGRRHRVAVNSRTAPEAQFRYEVTEIAAGVDAFADRIREQYRFALTGLSTAERAVVEEAIDGGYFEDGDAFRSVIDRIRGHEALNLEDFYGTWLLEYDDGEYLTYAEW